MPGIVNYSLPTDVLPAISIEIGGADPLFGYMSDFALGAPGTHSVHPYAVSTSPSTLFSTYSVVNPVPGTFSFAGLLVSSEESAQSLLGSLGRMNSGGPTVVCIVAPETQTVLGAWNLWDYRLASIHMTMHVMGNVTVVRGAFSGTYRNLTAHLP